MSERTTLRRVPERGVADLDVIHAALDEEITAHVGLVAGRGATAERDAGHPVVSVAVGEPEPEMMHAVELTEPHLPADKARYAMGLGTPAQLIELVARGVDMFDCVLPTRVARNGTAYTSRGAINLRASHQKEEFSPIEEGCECFACKHHTRAYLRHLLKAGEILGLRMLSVHNSHFFMEVMRDIRRH